MDKYLNAGFWLLMLLIVTPFLHAHIDYFVDESTGIMVTTYASWCPDYFVAFVGFIPWLFPLLCVVVIVWNIIKPDKSKGGEF